MTREAKNDLFRASGYFVVTNTMAVLVELSLDGSAARCAVPGTRCDGLADNCRPKWQSIKQDKDGRDYVRFYSIIIHLDSIMRIRP